MSPVRPPGKGGSPDGPEAWTVMDLVRWAEKDFTRRGILTPRLDAELLLSHALECRRIDLYLRHGDTPPEEALAAFRGLVARRRSREPVAYIIGFKGFRDIDLKVSPAVMVPRPETEILVDAAVSSLKSMLAGGRAGDSLLALDIGVGSGAIAVCLAREFPDIRVRATDISEPALELAKQNAALHGVEDRISFEQGNLFEIISEGESFDLIISNPPYIPTGDIPMLMPEVRDFEPRAALDGGPEGMDFIKAILDRAPVHLRPNGRLWLEVGDNQSKEITRSVRPPLAHIETIKDYSGRSRVMGFGI